MWYWHAHVKGSDTIITDDLYREQPILQRVGPHPVREGKRRMCHQGELAGPGVSSEKSFIAVYSSETSSRVMKCSGHVGRLNANALKELKSRRNLTVAMSQSTSAKGRSTQQSVVTLLIASLSQLHTISSALSPSMATTQVYCSSK